MYINHTSVAQQYSCDLGLSALAALQFNTSHMKYPTHPQFIRPCSHHSFGTGTVPDARVHTCSTASGCSGTSRPPRDEIAVERFRKALWCERATGPVPEPFQLPVTFVDSQPILHISKRSSLHGILPQIV